MTITTSIKVAGDIVSLDTWKEIFAVGSTEAQFFQFQHPNLQRTILCREEDPVKVVTIILYS